MPGLLYNKTEAKIGPKPRPKLDKISHPKYQILRSKIPSTKEQRCLVGCTTKPRPAAARSRDDTGNGYFYPTCPSYSRFLLIKCIWVNIDFYPTCPSYFRFLLIKCIWVNIDFYPTCRSYSSFFAHPMYLGKY